MNQVIIVENAVDVAPALDSEMVAAVIHRETRRRSPFWGETPETDGKVAESVCHVYIRFSFMSLQEKVSMGASPAGVIAHWLQRWKISAPLEGILCFYAREPCGDVLRRLQEVYPVLDVAL